jgi:hypothetical protein
MTLQWNAAYREQQRLITSSILHKRPGMGCRRSLERWGCIAFIFLHLVFWGWGVQKWTPVLRVILGNFDVLITPTKS